MQPVQPKSTADKLSLGGAPLMQDFSCKFKQLSLTPSSKKSSSSEGGVCRKKVQAHFKGPKEIIALSDSLFCRAMSYLDFRSVLRAMPTCKKFQGNTVFKNMMSLRVDINEMFSAFIQKAPAFATCEYRLLDSEICTRVTELSLHKRGFTSMDIHAIARRCKKLERLDLFQCSFSVNIHHAIESLSQLNGLKMLSLAQCPGIIVNDGAVLQTLSTFPALEQVDFSYSMMPCEQYMTHLGNFKCLKSVSMCPNPLTPEEQQNLKKKFPKIVFFMEPTVVFKADKASSAPGPTSVR